ncbi:hypothetical protein KSF78_0004183 [Schistosoma japonicum]|nr:hypothetical protein KSF78_0004183 [Schistosoma japonicum]
MDQSSIVRFLITKYNVNYDHMKFKLTSLQCNNNYYGMRSNNNQFVVNISEINGHFFKHVKQAQCQAKKAYDLVAVKRQK